MNLQKMMGSDQSISSVEYIYDHLRGIPLLKHVPNQEAYALSVRVVSPARVLPIAAVYSPTSYIGHATSFLHGLSLQTRISSSHLRSSYLQISEYCVDSKEVAFDSVDRLLAPVSKELESRAKFPGVF